MKPYRNLTKAIVAFSLSACLSVWAQQTPSPNQDKADQNQKTQTTPATPAGEKTTAAAQSGAELMVGPADQKFLTEAAQSGLMEVQLAQLAQQKATSDEVKQYAKQLETEHSNSNKELQTLATQKNVSVPTEMTPKQQQSVSKLQNAAAEKFDREYVKMMVDNHKKSIKSFQKQSERAMDSHVKEFASKTLPTLQQHLQKAESLQTATRSRQADDQPTRSRTDDQPGRIEDQPGPRVNQPDSRPTDPASTTDPTRRPQGQGNPTPPRQN